MTGYKEWHTPWMRIQGWLVLFEPLSQQKEAGLGKRKVTSSAWLVESIYYSSKCENLSLNRRSPCKRWLEASTPLLAHLGGRQETLGSSWASEPCLWDRKTEMLSQKKVEVMTNAGDDLHMWMGTCTYPSPHRWMATYMCTKHTDARTHTSLKVIKTLFAWSQVYNYL